MSVNEFMSINLVSIQKTISQMERPFDSHAFIQKFSKEFQIQYIQLLAIYNDKPFLKVHEQIGLFLSKNQEKLGIKKNGKVLSQNIFGEESENEQWV